MAGQESAFGCESIDVVFLSLRHHRTGPLLQRQITVSPSFSGRLYVRCVRPGIARGGLESPLGGNLAALALCKAASMQSEASNTRRLELCWSCFEVWFTGRHWLFLTTC